MLKKTLLAAAVAAVSVFAADVVDVAIGSADHSTLVAAVKAASLVDTLKGPGPFTVFAPTNAAFDKLPAGTVDTLLKPDNQAMLSGILTYHVVVGKVMSKDLIKLIKKSGNKAEVKTVAGGTLTASLVGTSVVLTDAKGNKATVKAVDLAATNGVVHVIDAVMLPN